MLCLCVACGALMPVSGYKNSLLLVCALFPAPSVTLLRAAGSSSLGLGEPPVSGVRVRTLEYTEDGVVTGALEYTEDRGMSDLTLEQIEEEGERVLTLE